MKYILLPLLIFAGSVLVHGQTARFLEDGSLVISDSNRRIKIPNVSEPVDEVPTAPCVHAIQKLDGAYFVVVTTSEWTRGFPPRGGAGGAGDEAYVMWMRIVDGKISETSRGRFRSWRDNRDGGIDGWHDSFFTVTADDLLEDRGSAKGAGVWQTIRWTFDSNHPDYGLMENKLPPFEG